MKSKSDDYRVMVSGARPLSDCESSGRKDIPSARLEWNVPVDYLLSDEFNGVFVLHASLNQRDGHEDGCSETRRRSKVKAILALVETRQVMMKP